MIKYVITICKEIELLLGSLKFAVFIILVFALALIIGTFQESYHGTDYANRLVYKSAWFISIQVLMFLSIFMATTLRLPYQHRLRGFYVIHSGLLTLFIGSFVTYQKGLDGSITLMPKSETKNLVLNSDQVYISEVGSDAVAELELPYTAFSTHINKPWKEITILKYLPFANKKVQWLPITTPALSGHYILQNPMTSQEVILSLVESSSFAASETYGPLNTHLLPTSLYNCFETFPKDKFLFWDAENSVCIGQSSPQVKEKVGKTKKIIIKDKNRNKEYVFSPDQSPLPLVNGVPTKETPWRLFNRSLFEQRPHLLFFGSNIAFFDKNLNSWQHLKLEKDRWVELPWMNFKIQLIRFDEKSYPAFVPEYTTPIQDNNNLISGNERAVEVGISTPAGNQNFWVYQDQVMNVQIHGKSYEIGLRKRIQTLPYTLRLTQFILGKDPGTQNPASYESLVTLAPNEGGKISEHRIFMNNPLKYDDLTFYQASYFETQNGEQGSVLSVNYDPGRWLKYLGSLLLVLGSIWHFGFIRRKEKG